MGMRAILKSSFWENTVKAANRRKKVPRLYSTFAFCIILFSCVSMIPFGDFFFIITFLNLVNLQCGKPRFYPWVGKIPRRRKQQPIPVLFPGKSHGPRSLVGFSPWGHKESDMTERLHFSFPKLKIKCTLGTYVT